jgi:hypothetical protein
VFTDRYGERENRTPPSPPVSLDCREFRSRNLEIRKNRPITAYLSIELDWRELLELDALAPFFLQGANGQSSFAPLDKSNVKT